MCRRYVYAVKMRGTMQWNVYPPYVYAVKMRGDVTRTMQWNVYPPYVYAVKMRGDVTRTMQWNVYQHRGILDSGDINPCFIHKSQTQTRGLAPPFHERFCQDGTPASRIWAGFVHASCASACVC